MTATVTTKADSPAKTDEKAKAPEATKAPEIQMPKALSAKEQKEAEAAYATLRKLNLIDDDEHQESLVQAEMVSLYSMVMDCISKVEEAPNEGEGILIHASGMFYFQEWDDTDDDEDDTDDDEDDDRAAKKAKKKAKKAAKAATKPQGDWKKDGKKLQTALIKYVQAENKKAQDILTVLTKGGKNANPPAIGTIYNWLKGSSIPNQRYHRKLRSLLGLQVS